MKLNKNIFLLTVITFLSGISGVDGQDGWFTSAQPPIVVREGVGDHKAYLTNTSDKTIFGITLHFQSENSDLSHVIIDSIGPHKTAALSISSVIYLKVDGASLTCKDYTKRLPVKL